MSRGPHYRRVCFTKAQERANLGPVIFDGAAIPIISAPLLGWYPYLRRQVGHRGRGYVLRPLGKAPLALKELEEDRKAQPCWPAFTPDQGLLSG
jgi:hypothetical protein